MEKYDFTSVGEVLIDFTPAGISVGGAALYQRNLGGAPVNVACAIAKLGRSSAFIGMAGDDAFGNFCKDTMRGLNVDVKGFILSPDKNTTLAFVHLSDTGDRSFSFYRKNSADVNLSIPDLDMEIVRNSKIFHFGSVSLSDEPSRSATIHSVREAKKSGSVISFDPNIRMNLWDNHEEMKAVILDVMRYADIIKLSDEEAGFLFGRCDCAAAIGMMTDRFGASVAFITRGPRGAATVTGGRLYESPAYNVNIIDTTGAGDCFLAGALNCLMSFGKLKGGLTREETEYMLAFANASGSLAGAKMGAVTALPSARDIELCMQNTEPLILADSQ